MRYPNPARAGSGVEPVIKLSYPKSSFDDAIALKARPQLNQPLCKCRHNIYERLSPVKKSKKKVDPPPAGLNALELYTMYDRVPMGRS